MSARHFQTGVRGMAARPGPSCRQRSPTCNSMPPPLGTKNSGDQQRDLERPGAETRKISIFSRLAMPWQAGERAGRRRPAPEVPAPGFTSLRAAPIHPPPAVVFAVGGSHIPLIRTPRSRSNGARLCRVIFRWLSAEFCLFHSPPASASAFIPPEVHGAFPELLSSSVLTRHGLSCGALQCPRLRIDRRKRRPGDRRKSFCRSNRYRRPPYRNLSSKA